MLWQDGLKTMDFSFSGSKRSKERWEKVKHLLKQA